jgi:hypothetical protein
VKMDCTLQVSMQLVATPLSCEFPTHQLRNANTMDNIYI